MYEVQWDEKDLSLKESLTHHPLDSPRGSLLISNKQTRFHGDSPSDRPEQAGLVSVEGRGDGRL